MNSLTSKMNRTVTTTRGQQTREQVFTWERRAKVRDEGHGLQAE